VLSNLGLQDDNKANGYGGRAPTRIAARRKMEARNKEAEERRMAVRNCPFAMATLDGGKLWIYRS
jgi:hypothetical protein